MKWKRKLSEVMAKKVKKSVQVEKYKDSYALQVQELIAGFALTRIGGLAFSKIAKGLGVSARTMLKWRTVDHDLYKAAFVGAIKEAEKKKREAIALELENISLGKINAGVVKRAQGYKKKKVIKEPIVTGPAHPPYSRYSKADLKSYSKSCDLGLNFNKSDSKGAIEIKIRKRIDALQVEALRVVRTEEEFVPSDITAAKYANQNMGKKEERWTDEQKVEHDVSDDLADIIKGISGDGKGMQISDRTS